MKGRKFGSQKFSFVIIIINLFNISFLKRSFINDGLKLIEFCEVYMWCEKKRSKRNLISKERNWILL